MRRRTRAIWVAALLHALSACSSEQRSSDAGAISDIGSFDAGTTAPPDPLVAIEVVFPPDVTFVQCGEASAPGASLRLSLADFDDEVLVCFGTSPTTTWSTVLVFDNTGRLVWAPSARDGEIVAVDERSTAIATAFTAPYLANANPVRAQAILDELRASPYLDAAESAFASGEGEFLRKVSELVDDTLRRLARHAIVMEPDALTQISLSGSDLSLQVREGVGADFLCEVHAIDSPLVCGESELAGWNERTPAHRSGLIRTHSGGVRARLEARSYWRYLDLPGVLIEQLGAAFDEANYQLAGAGTYQVVCSAGGFWGDLDRDITFANTVVRENGAGSSPWDLHWDATVLNLVSIFVDTLAIVMGEGILSHPLIETVFIEIPAELARQLENALSEHGVDRLSDVPTFDQQVATVFSAIYGVFEWFLAQEVVDGVLGWGDSVLERIVGVGELLVGLVNVLSRISSAGQAIDRIAVLSFGAAPFDWYYLATGYSCAPPDAGMPPDAGAVPDGAGPPDTGTSTCLGSSLEPCGRCGSRTRSCVGGAWTAWSSCAGEGVCMPDTTESCGAGGVRTCTSSCAWDVCRECPGAAERECGRCGTQTRVCSAGTWGAWSSCTGEGECSPTATEACGSGGVRTCGASCTWGGCMECAGSSAQPCGRCGTQSRVCSGGVWSSWSACGGEGVCDPADTQSCMGTGTQTCTSSCAWGACTNYCGDTMCDPGETCSSCPECACPTRQRCVSDACVACGDLMQPCCSLSCPASSSLVCFGDQCLACGAAGQPCCSGGTCNATLTCSGASCQPSGPTVIFTENFETTTWDQVGPGTLSDGIAVWDIGGPSLRTRTLTGASGQGFGWYGGGVGAVPSSATMTLPPILDAARTARVTFDGYSAVGADITILVGRAGCAAMTASVSSAGWSSHSITLPACGTSSRIVLQVGNVYAYTSASQALKFDNIRVEYP